MLDINTEQPIHVNEQGVKWLVDKDLTKYSRERGFSVSIVFIVERPDGYRTRLLTEGENILYEDQSLDGMCFKIDALSTISRRYIDKTNILDLVIEGALQRNNPRELALDHIRYMALRKLKPRQFEYLNKLNIDGRNFDDMVDEIAADTFDWSGMAFIPRFIGETDT